MNKGAAILLGVLLSVSSAHADRVAFRGGNCGEMREQVSVNVSFNAQLPSPGEAKQRYESRLKEIEGLVQEAKVKSWKLQSMNYSVSSSNYGYGDPTFQLSGSASYQTDDAEKAFALMDQFAKRGMQLNVSVNKYVNNPCPNE